MNEHPDLTVYRIIHRGMRADTARLASAVRSLTEAERATRVPDVERWYKWFLTEFQGPPHRRGRHLLPRPGRAGPRVRRPHGAALGEHVDVPYDQDGQGSAPAAAA